MLDWQNSATLDHNVVSQYLEESYLAVSQGLWLSATLMLGASSDRTPYLLLEAVSDVRGDENSVWDASTLGIGCQGNDVPLSTEDENMK